MSLFQSSILNKYLQALDKVLVAQKWEIFKAHFQNPVIQENIRQSKEEQYQEGFLRDLFVSVFGYTLNPSPGYNLTTEYKNVKDSKKADGAILARGHAPLAAPSVRAIIELKGNDTTDLDKIEPQAFGYKNNQPECKYIIISNFEKLRFYIENTVDYLEFNLFTLTETDFQLLWLCLSCKNIIDDIPALIKNASISHEEDITKQLYKDYSLFKRELYQNLTELNPQYNELELFRKSQKLLDRILFLLFGEDRYLLPPNSLRLILEQWNKLKELDEYVPLYSRFKKYFEYLNTGFKGKTYDVFAYNGGLFKSDEILDSVKIDDELLYNHTLKLSAYNFESDVDVNILGHIFENSLNEIDEIKAQLEGKEIDKAQTKRKKDGVFYTPKYITKYIVENTVGRLCTEKKAELGIVEEEYTADKKRNVSTKQALMKRLTEYREWLLKITIVDPACGSGAFLNQALVFLMDEHQYIDELETKLTGGSIVFPNIENSILENNLFGVDLNEESVEIAKLSLWLRTAKPNRKLNDLNSNIKCGNSLIDDPEVAGDKAFNWHTEFSQVFTLKDKKIWHVTWVTHDTRTSARMIKYKVREFKRNGEGHIDRPYFFDEKEAIEITRIISDIIVEDNYNCLEYNVCSDHIHTILVCDEEDLPNVVRKLKGKSAQKFKEYLGLDKEDTFHLWAQKFDRNFITSETELQNKINYIRNNRAKHVLPDINKGLQPLVDRMRCTLEHALRPEYKGGFDVVIGNPPYGAELDKKTMEYLTRRYIKGGGETAISFIKLVYDDLLKDQGEFGFIIPKSFSFSSNYKSIRDYILNDISKIIDCKKVWKEVLLEQVMIFFTKNKTSNNYISGKLMNNIVHEVGIIPKHTYNKFDFYLNDVSNEELDISLKINSTGWYLNSISTNTRGGMFQKLISETGNFRVLGGADIQREGIIGEKGFIDEYKIKDDAKSFIENNSILVQNIVAHIENPTDHIKITACIPDSGNVAILDTINQITFNDTYNSKVFWIMFNSKLINWYVYRFIFAKAIRTMHFDNSVTNRIPIPKEFNQQPFILKADLMLSLNKELQLLVDKFQRNIQREFGLQSLTGKLQSWHDLLYADFLRELAKAKVSLTLSQKAEWEAYFTAEQQKAQNLKQQIAATDTEIDRMVYELYGLTEEEIRIVEGE